MVTKVIKLIGMKSHFKFLMRQAEHFKGQIWKKFNNSTGYYIFFNNYLTFVQSKSLLCFKIITTKFDNDH
jgi:hypothetical protein